MATHTLTSHSGLDFPPEIIRDRRAQTSFGNEVVIRHVVDGKGCQGEFAHKVETKNWSQNDKSAELIISQNKLWTTCSWLTFRIWKHFGKSNLHAPICICLRNLAKSPKPPQGPLGGRTPVSSSPPSHCVPCATENSMVYLDTFIARALNCHDEIKAFQSLWSTPPSMKFVYCIRPHWWPISLSKNLFCLSGALTWQLLWRQEPSPEVLAFVSPRICWQGLSGKLWQAGVITMEGGFMIGCIWLREIDETWRSIGMILSASSSSSSSSFLPRFDSHSRWRTCGNYFRSVFLNQDLEVPAQCLIHALLFRGKVHKVHPDVPQRCNQVQHCIIAYDVSWQDLLRTHGHVSSLWVNVVKL